MPSNKFNSIYLKAKLVSAALICAICSYAQFNNSAEISNSIDFLYEISNSTCDPDMEMVAGIRVGISGNFNTDQLVFGKMDLITGVLNPLTTYPANVGTHFNIQENVAMTASKNILNNNDGHIMVFSAQDQPNGEFNLHVVKVDCNGNPFWSLNPYDLNGFSEYCNEIFQDSNGDYVLAGYREGGGLTREPLVLKIDRNGNVTETKVLHLDQNGDGSDDRSFATDIIEVSGTGTSARYVVSGAAGNDAFIATLDNIFDPLDHSFYDIDSDPATGDRISQIEKIGSSFWATGVGNLGVSGGRYTFVINVNALIGFVPILNVNWTKKYQLNNLDNYPGDLVPNIGGNGVVIAGTMVSTSTAINFPTKGFMIEVIGGGAVNFAWEQNNSNDFGALLELEKRGGAYLGAGYFSGSGAMPASGFKFLEADLNGDTGGCQESLQASDISTTATTSTQLVTSEDFMKSEAFWGFTYGNVAHTPLNCAVAPLSFDINVFKYEDLNCDGNYTPGTDTPLPNWTIEIRQNGGLVATGTTDVSGKYSASLAAGTYTVSETLTAPWLPSSTNAPSQVVTIGVSNPLAQVDFGNKNPKSCSCIGQQIVDNGNCCYEILIDNNFGPFYDEIRISYSGPGSLVNITPSTGWTQTQSGNTITYTHSSGLVPVGSSISLGTFCAKGIYGPTPVKIQWLQNGDLQCENDLNIDCPCPTEPGFTLFDKNLKVQSDQTTESLDIASDVIQDPAGNFVFAGVQFIDQVDPSGVVINVPLPYLMKTDPSGNVILGPVFIDLIGNQFNQNTYKVQVENHYYAGSWTGYSIAMDGVKNGNEYIHLTYLDPTFKKICERPVYLNGSDLRLEDYLLQGNSIFMVGQEDQINNNLLVLKIPAQTDCLNDFYQIASYPGLEKGVSIATSGLTPALHVTGKRGSQSYLIKIDQNLNLLNFPTGNNTKLFGLNNNSHEPIDIGTKASGNYVIAGNLTQSSTNDQEYFILEYNENSNFVGYNYNRYDTPEDNIRMTEMKLDPVNGGVGIVGTKDDQTTLITTDRLSHSMVLNPVFDEIGHANYVFGTGYLESSSQAFDFASDGGLVIAHGIVNDPCSGFCLNEYDSRITKTGPLGYLDDCECYYPSCSEKIQEIDVFTEVNEIGIILSAIFTSDSIGCKEIPYSEQACRGGNLPVCMVSTTATSTNVDSCCLVSLNLSNNNPSTSPVHKIQIDLIGPPGIFFDNINSNGLSGFQIVPAGTNRTRIVLQSSAGIGTALPSGSSIDYVNFCYGNSTRINLPTQQLKISYFDATCTLIPDCMDTLNTSCVAIPIDDDCYEVTTVSIDCDSLPNLFLYCFNVTNYSPTKTLKWIEFNNTSSVVMTPASPYCLTAPVAPLSTGSQECVYLYDYSGLSLPRPIKLYPEMHDIDSTFCCNDLDSLCIILPNCCDPCDTTWVTLDTLSSQLDSCCFALDIYNECDFTLTKIVTESLTPGVNLGSVFLGGPNASQWTIQRYTGTLVEWKPTTSTAPKGFSNDLINFCLDDSLGTPNQDVAIHYVMQSSLGLDSIACSDTLRFACSKDVKCLELVSDTVYCDMNGNYFVDVKLMNVSSPSFIADRIDVSHSSLQGLFPVPSTFIVTPFGPGAMTTLTMQLRGIPSALPGQQIDLSFIMHDNLTPPLDTCCFESVDLSVILPPCPNCCDDFQAFCNDITFQSSIYGVCDTGFVDIMFADTCTYADIDWGDGSTESRQGAFSARHFYSSPGQYIVCADFKESSDGGLTFCWNKLICDTLNISTCPPDGSTLICDSIMWDTLPVLGWAAATFRLTGPNDPVLALMDIRKHQDAIGSNWDGSSAPTALNIITGRGPTLWDKNTLGEIYGIAVDPKGNIFVSANGMNNFNNSWGIAGSPAIYKVNAISGVVSIVNDVLPQQIDLGVGIPRNPGFGNLAYNYKNDLLYVSNLEDGKIYALDPNGLNVIVDVFDYNFADAGAPGYAPLGEIIFGIGYNPQEDALYFGDWLNDSGIGNSLDNSVYKIGLNPSDGKFIGAPSLQFTIPKVTPPFVSNPVTDISFDQSGTRMLISEMSMQQNTGILNHARTLEYYKVGVAWIAEPVSKYQSLLANGTNAFGGNDYAYGDSTLVNCDSLVLMTERSYLFNNPRIERVRGVSASGGTVSSSVRINVSGNLPTGSTPGDVEVFRDLCSTCGSVSICDSLDWSGFAIVLDTNCVGGIFPDITLTTNTGSTIPDWVEYDYACDNSIDLSNSGAPYLPHTIQNITSPNFAVCATAYKVVNGDTCMRTVTMSISLPPCPTSSPADCCDSLWIYGDGLEDLPTKIKQYGGYTYLASTSRNPGNTNTLFPTAIFSKFDGRGRLIWDVKLQEFSQIFDFVKTDDDAYLLVGRTEPARAGSDRNNLSILAKVREDGTVAFIRTYENKGREGFFKIVKHHNPADAMFPYYIGALENDHSRNYPSAFDEYHLYNLNENGVMNWNKEYTFTNSTNTLVNDDQWQGLLALNNGNLLISGDYDPIFNGVLVEVNGTDGGIVNDVESSVPARFYDAVELNSGQRVVVGRYNSAAGIEAGIFLMTSSFGIQDAIKYSNGSIKEFRSIHKSSSSELIAVGTGQNDIPVIFKFEVDFTTNRLIEKESKYFLDGETSFTAPQVYTNPGLSRIYYADARKGNPKMLGDFDIIFGSFNEMLSDTCLRDTVITSIQDPFGLVQTTTTRIDTLIPNPDTMAYGLANLIVDDLCPGSSTVISCDSIDWSPFSFQLLYDCSNPDPLTGYPQVDIVPQIGNLSLYKIDYDAGDDGNVEVSDMTFGPLIHPAFTNPNLFMSATAYIILSNGDTCTHKEIRDLTVGPCPPACCIDQSEFDNDVESIEVVRLENGSVEVRYPDLNACHEVSINWGDDEESMMMGSSMMTMHTYASSGDFAVEVNVKEINDDGSTCFETSISELITNTADLSSVLDFKVFPNPFEQDILILFNAPVRRVEIFNLHGQSIKSLSDFDGNEEARISLRNVVKGIYIVRVYGENGREGIKRIVKM